MLSCCFHGQQFRNEDLLRCSQCKIARYCGKRCQKEDWQDHKRECKCLKSIEPNIPPDSVRLVGRIVFKLLRESACPSEKLYTLADLQSNIEKLSEEMKEGLGHLAQTLQLYLKAEVQDASQLSPAIDIFQIFAKREDQEIRWNLHEDACEMEGKAVDLPCQDIW
ncbi:histone-lysine N-methyltransferase SMYD3-like [Alligator mississippiensis]|uniref:[histone H3]-lysine(4) N-trimethyltransferase n=1 Tax=Alligator mississippiensis TaxID=8496 RepID=A0A151MH54_ALLMI|nr:histone-lysine N-methyltransferase SMYD3-like [Alligator mississippiensis]